MTQGSSTVEGEKEAFDRASARRDEKNHLHSVLLVGRSKKEGEHTREEILNVYYEIEGWGWS